MAEDSDDDFQTKYKLLQREHEKLVKRIGQSEKEVNTLQTSVNEYQEVIMGNLENESVNSRYTKQLDECNSELIELEANIKEKREVYKKEICEKDTEIQILTSKLEEAKSKSSKVEIPKVDEDVQNTLVSLHEKSEELNEKVSSMQSELSLKIEENAALAEKVKDLEKEVQQYRVLADSESLKLEELNVVFSQVEDDYLSLKTAHNTRENKPLDAENQGNSLFAEVNTR